MITIYGTNKAKISILIKLLKSKNKEYEIINTVRFAGDPSVVINNIIYNYTQALFYIRDEM